MRQVPFLQTLIILVVLALFPVSAEEDRAEWERLPISHWTFYELSEEKGWHEAPARLQRVKVAEGEETGWRIATFTAPTDRALVQHGAETNRRPGNIQFSGMVWIATDGRRNQASIDGGCCAGLDSPPNICCRWGPTSTENHNIRGWAIIPAPMPRAWMLKAV